MIWTASHCVSQGEAYNCDSPKFVHADYASAIRDSGFKHALRLYRDKSTNAVRLEASVLDKEMKEYVPLMLSVP